MPAKKTGDQTNLPDIDEDSPGPAADVVEPDAEDESKESNVVRYIGIFSERRVTKEDFENAGVSDQDGVVWTKDSKSVSIDRFNEDALRVLSGTGEFQIIRDR